MVSFVSTTKTEKISEVGYFQADKKSGKWKYYYPSGNLRAIAYYRDDNIHGKWQHFREDGTLMVIKTYDNGKHTGDYNGFYNNGELREKGFLPVGYSHRRVAIFSTKAADSTKQTSSMMAN